MSKLQKEREAILEAAEGGEKFDEKRLASIEKELKTRNATLDRQVEGYQLLNDKLYLLSKT